MIQKETNSDEQDNQSSTMPEDSHSDHVEDRDKECVESNESDDDVTYIVEKMAPAIGEALNRRHGKWKVQLTEEISACVERNVVQSLEDRLTLLIETCLDDRFDEWKNRVIEKFLAAMLEPNSQFLMNLRPLMVQILAERWHRNVPINTREMIDAIVEDKVRQGMRSLVKLGGTFERDALPVVSNITKECLQRELRSLLTMASAEAASGPMERISATVDPDTADQMRALGGNFSEHVRNALKFYLQVLEAKR